MIKLDYIYQHSGTEDYNPHGRPLMTRNMQSLSAVFDGWDGYQTSIVHAVQPLTQEQLTYRPAPHLRTPAEIAGHLAIGRIYWFSRMPAPGSLEMARKVEAIGGEAA